MPSAPPWYPTVEEANRWFGGFMAIDQESSEYLEPLLVCVEMPWLVRKIALSMVRLLSFTSLPQGLSVSLFSHPFGIFLHLAETHHAVSTSHPQRMTYLSPHCQRKCVELQVELGSTRAVQVVMGRTARFSCSPIMSRVKS